jgi:ABC-type amino acid transport substrate-binding protein
LSRRDVVHARRGARGGFRFQPESAQSSARGRRRKGGRASAAGLRFRSFAFTVAIAPFAPPIATYAKPEDAAGLTIITGSGTNQEKILLEWSRRNATAGFKSVALQYYDDQAANVLALLSGRADAIFNPNGPLAYEAAKHGRIRRVGTVNAGWPLKSDVVDFRPEINKRSPTSPNWPLGTIAPSAQSA